MHSPLQCPSVPMRAGEDADWGRVGCIHRTLAFPLAESWPEYQCTNARSWRVLLMSTEDLGHQRSSSGTGHMGTTTVTSWDKAGVELVGVGVGWQVGVSW